MPIAEARVRTERASRYLTQLCEHATKMGHRSHLGSRTPVTADWSETEGTITLDGGTCALRATPHELTLRIEAADEDRLSRIRTLLTANVTRMGRRDNLAVSWDPPEPTHNLAVSWDPPEPTPPPHNLAVSRDRPEAAPPPRRGRYTVAGLALAGVLAVAVHAGLVAGVLTAPRWAGWGADVVLVAVVVKAALVAAHLWRRRQAR
ncbi:MAG: DUF2218 domain-containing protein [Nonomuraea sp.]|nr:DUF2218 domain-containing protein [Nonomuraea sp.]